MSTTALTSACKRIQSLLDEGSFVELGGCVTARSTDFNMAAKKQPSDGVVTGYGTVDGNLVYVYSQDESVLGGTMGEMHAKKISEIYSMAMKMGAPVIGFIDCAGFRLQEATDALSAFGSLYMNQVKASGVVLQITAVFGSCGGGMALVPALTDFTFMEKKTGKLFVNAPNTLERESSDKCDTSSADFQCAKSGMVDFAGDQDEIIEKIRELLSLVPANCEDEIACAQTSDDLNRLTSGIEDSCADPAYTLRKLSDEGRFFEVKPEYAKEMVCGFIRLNDQTVGAVANRSVLYDENGNEAEKFDLFLSSEGCGKAADFVKYCDAFGIPVLTLTNAAAFKACVCQERTLAKSAAKLMAAFADASVPKVNLITGRAYGTPYVIMNSKSIGADLTFAWPDSSIGMMDSAAAVKIIYADEIKNEKSPAAFIADKAAQYEKEAQSARAAAQRGYIDAVIDPAQTRKNLIAAFEMLYTKKAGCTSKRHSAI